MRSRRVRPGELAVRLLVAVALSMVMAACSPDTPVTVTGASPSASASDPTGTTQVANASATSEAAPSFSSTVREVTTDDLGSTWQPGCPVQPDDLSIIAMSYWGFDGRSATGELVVANRIATAVVEAFAELYEARFPVRKMITIDHYGGDDNASMADDNTSGFNCRPVTGGSGWSQHAYGLAIDINPLENPYVQADEVLPPAGREYLDRSLARPGMILEGDVVVRAFTSRGFEWGGRWTSLQDYQHVALPR